MPAAHAQGHVRARVCIRHTCARTRVCRMDAQSIARRRAAGMHTYAGWHRGHRKGANCSWEERTTLSLSLSLSLHTRRRGVRHQQFVGGEQYYCYYYSLPPPLRTPVRCTYARRETRARKGCAGNYSSTPTLLRSAKAWCVCVCVCVCIRCCGSQQQGGREQEMRGTAPSERRILRGKSKTQTARKVD